MASSVLAVGDPSRESTRRALVWCLACSVLFTAFAFWTTQDKPLRAHSPWQDDPYDVVVSFTQLVVPVLAGAIAMRALHCRRNLPLPAVRVRDLLRGARVVTGAIVMTVAVDWVAVVLGVNGHAWGGPGRALIAALAVVTAAALASVAALWAAERRARVWRRYRPSTQDPDWVEDLLAAVVEQLGRWGLAWRGATQAVAWVQRVVIDGRHGMRRHRVVAALAAAIGVGLALALAEAAGEGVSADPLVVITHGALLVTIGASGLFAVLVAVGSYLRLVRSATVLPATVGGRGWQPALLWAGFAAAGSVPFSVAFRDQLGALAGYPITGNGRAAVLIAICSTAAAVTSLVIRAAAGRRRS